MRKEAASRCYIPEEDSFQPTAGKSLSYKLWIFWRHILKKRCNKAIQLILFQHFLNLVHNFFFSFELLLNHLSNPKATCREWQHEKSFAIELLEFELNWTTTVVFACMCTDLIFSWNLIHQCCLHSFTHDESQFTGKLQTRVYTMFQVYTLIYWNWSENFQEISKYH